MKEEINSKIVGATIIGFALVAGGYTISNFGKEVVVQQAANVLTATPPARIVIDVNDDDNNGIEDWRDQFITTEGIRIDEDITEYKIPDTLTGKMSISFMQGIMNSRVYGGYSKTDEEVIQDTVDYLAKETTQKLYSTSEVDIMETWEGEDVANYANTAAASIYRNSNPDLAGEIDILNDVIRNKNFERLDELNALAAVYAGYRDDTLKIPVPAIMAKEHIDLINTYEAIHYDISAMALYATDPAVSLLRLKSYEGDATAMGIALQNIYTAIVPYSEFFSVEDPGILFTVFAPKYQN